MLRNLIYAGRNFLRRYPIVTKQAFSLQNSANDEPVKFSASKASQWKASFTRSGDEKEKDEAVWEENDIDEMLGTSLYDRIEGLEEAQLRILLKYNLEHGKETADIMKRIRELEFMRGKVKES